MIAKLLISSSREEKAGEIGKIFKKYGLTNPHPDLLYFPYGTKLGIEQARKIKDHFSLKPYSAKGRAVALEDASTLTPEAQNALLKTLEELPEHSLFILGADSETKLLPTVISRCQVDRGQGTGDRGQEENYIEDIENLLKVSIEERFDYIEKIKDREEFLYAMVHYFHRQLQDYTHPRPGLAKLNAEFLRNLLQAEEWQKQNVNIRAILEYLMLVMPK